MDPLLGAPAAGVRACSCCDMRFDLYFAEQIENCKLGLIHPYRRTLGFIAGADRG